MTNFLIGLCFGAFLGLLCGVLVLRDLITPDIQNKINKVVNRGKNNDNNVNTSQEGKIEPKKKEHKKLLRKRKKS